MLYKKIKKNLIIDLLTSLEHFLLGGKVKWPKNSEFE